MFIVPFLSLGTVLVALGLMVPANRPVWLWRTLCFGAALPPWFTLVLMFLTAPSDIWAMWVTISLLVSAPFAAMASLMVAARLWWAA